MQQSQFSQAASNLQSLADRYCDPRASLLFAAALEAQGDASAAEAALRLAHTHWPANNSIAASLSRQYMASGQVSRAGQALAHFHATADTPMQEMELATVVFIADHQLVPARTVAETAYRAHPSLRSLLLLANAMQLQGRFKDVVAMLNAKRSLYKDSAPFLITLAESEFDSILYGAAQRDLQQALVLDPGSYQAHFLLGNALLKLDHADEAAGEYRRAIALSPQQPRTYYQLALALQAQQDQPGAEEQLTKALSLDAHYGPALIEISKILIAQHRPADAVNRLTVAVQDNPRSEQSYFLLARAYAQLGDQQKSEEMGKQLILVRNSNAQGSGNMDHRQRDGQPIANP